MAQPNIVCFLCNHSHHGKRPTIQCYEHLQIVDFLCVLRREPTGIVCTLCGFEIDIAYLRNICLLLREAYHDERTKINRRVANEVFFFLFRRRIIIAYRCVIRKIRKIDKYLRNYH